MSSKHKIVRKNNPTLNVNIYKETRTRYFEIIHKTKRDMWLSFLKNAKNKKIFDAYKYTKQKNYDKISSIVYQNKLHVNFEEKCENFTHAYYSNQIQNVENNFDFKSNMETNHLPWERLTEDELKEIINSFNGKKACGPDGINFIIIQKTFKIISKTFELICSKLMELGYHPKAWRGCTEIVIKKPNRPDYTISKAYRIISLENCLGKTLEKLMTNQLSY